MDIGQVARGKPEDLPGRVARNQSLLIRSHLYRGGQGIEPATHAEVQEKGLGGCPFPRSPAIADMDPVGGHQRPVSNWEIEEGSPGVSRRTVLRQGQGASEAYP